MNVQKFIEITKPLDLKIESYTLDPVSAEIILNGYEETKVINYIIEAFKTLKNVQTAEIFVNHLQKLELGLLETHFSK
jgi:hypothetical protein